MAAIFSVAMLTDSEETPRASNALTNVRFGGKADMARTCQDVR
jgi:hypothetical protein